MVVAYIYMGDRWWSATEKQWEIIINTLEVNVTPPWQEVFRRIGRPACIRSCGQRDGRYWSEGAPFFRVADFTYGDWVDAHLDVHRFIERQKVMV
jgi:hypothetical protein